MEKKLKKPKLVLHCCCGPCAAGAIPFLTEKFDIVAFYCNSNLESKQEYEKRLLGLRKIVGYFKKQGKKIKIVKSKFEHNNFLKDVKGLENTPEGGARCEKCFFERLEKTAVFAKKKNFDCFATTLTTSPHKNFEKINKIGQKVSLKNNIKYLESNFKKQDGFVNGLKIAKQLELYLQSFCGCEFSKRKKYE